MNRMRYIKCTKIRIHHGMIPDEPPLLRCVRFQYVPVPNLPSPYNNIVFWIRMYFTNEYTSYKIYWYEIKDAEYYVAQLNLMLILDGPDQLKVHANIVQCPDSPDDVFQWWLWCWILDPCDLVTYMSGARPPAAARLQMLNPWLMWWTQSQRLTHDGPLTSHVAAYVSTSHVVTPLPSRRRYRALSQAPTAATWIT